MKKIFFIIAALFLAAPALAADVSGGASVDVLSNYVWRGQKLSDDHGVIQPSVTAGSGAFSANLWANEDLTNTEHTETDFTIDYAYRIDKVSVDAGYIYYALDGADDTQEIFLSVGYDTLLSPSVTLYYDYDEGEGGFLVFSVSHSFELPREADLSVSASVSVDLDNAVMGQDKNGEAFVGFYNAEIGATISVPVYRNLSIEPKVAWSFPLTDDARAAIEGLSFDSASSTVYGGAAISMS